MYKRKTYKQGVLDGKQSVSDALKRPELLGVPVSAGTMMVLDCLGKVIINASEDLYLIGLLDGLVIKRRPTNTTGT